MPRLSILSYFALALALGCGSTAAAKPPASRPVFAPTNAKGVPLAMGTPADPLRGRGPALFITLPEIRGRIRSSPQGLVLLHMWATWCPPCMEELPMIAELAGTLPARGIDLLSVAMDEDTPRNATLVGRVIDAKANSALTRAVARYSDADAFVAGLDPRWEGSIPAMLAYNRSGALVGALYGEANRAEIDRFLADLEPERQRSLQAPKRAGPGK